MLTDKYTDTVLVKNNESGAIAHAVLTGKTSATLDVNLKGVPLIFALGKNDRYTATFSSLSLELVSD